jgi:hypothetical protein
MRYWLIELPATLATVLWHAYLIALRLYWMFVGTMGIVLVALTAWLLLRWALGYPVTAWIGMPDQR